MPETLRIIRIRRQLEIEKQKSVPRNVAAITGHRSPGGQCQNFSSGSQKRPGSPPRQIEGCFFKRTLVRPGLLKLRGQASPRLRRDPEGDSSAVLCGGDRPERSCERNDNVANSITVSGLRRPKPGLCNHPGRYVQDALSKMRVMRRDIESHQRDSGRTAFVW